MRVSDEQLEYAAEHAGDSALFASIMADLRDARSEIATLRAELEDVMGHNSDIYRQLEKTESARDQEREWGNAMQEAAGELRAECDAVKGQLQLARNGLEAIVDIYGNRGLTNEAAYATAEQTLARITEAKGEWECTCAHSSRDPWCPIHAEAQESAETARWPKPRGRMMTSGIPLLDRLDEIHAGIASHPEHAMRHMAYHTSYPTLRTMLIEARDALRYIHDLGTSGNIASEEARIAEVALAKLEDKDG